MTGTPKHSPAVAVALAAFRKGTARRHARERRRRRMQYLRRIAPNFEMLMFAFGLVLLVVYGVMT